MEPFLLDFEFEKFGTFMDGDNIYNTTLPKQGVLILGNEANGVSEAVETLVDKRISIPRFGNLKRQRA